MLMQVRTENGVVEGLEAADPRIISFKGIPFAAPPVGERRWRAPQPAENWEGMLKAYRFAPISVQNPPGADPRDLYSREWNVNPGIAMSEDCLYLNVWTPADSEKDALPVYVWFFGGGFQCGNTAEMEFDGERLARRGIVVVTVNYRLNVFGFLAHPLLTAEQPETPTNYGHLDQQAGIKWVKRNIRAFGGNPEQITIGGQSAGGGSVMMHLTSPQSEGLFQGAIVDSGALHYPCPGLGVRMVRTMETAEDQGRQFFEFAGISSLEEGRRMEAGVLLEKYNAFHGLFTSVIDGKFGVGDPVLQVSRNQCMQVPILSGNTTTEFRFAFPEEDTEAYIRKAAGSLAQDYIECCREKMKESVTQVRSLAAASDMPVIEYSVRLMFEGGLKSGNEQNHYYYVFDPDIPGADHPGTFHSSDLWFWFETLAKCWRPFHGQHYDLSRMMCNYWANFIRTGNPNGLDADGMPMPEWERYTKERPACMRMTQNGPKPEIFPASGPMRILLNAL